MPTLHRRNVIVAIAVPKISRSALFSALVATVLFGSVPGCVRLVQLDSIALGIVRLVLGSVGMAAVLAAQRRGSVRQFSAEVRREWPVMAAIGILFGLHWLTFFLSIKVGSASIGTLAFSTYGAQLPLLGWAFGFGRPRAAALIGAGLALVGTWLCKPTDGWDGAAAAGLAIGVLSGASYALLPLLHQRHAHMDHEIRTWAQFMFALPVFGVLAPWSQWSMSWSDFWLVIHLGLVVTLIGHLLWVKATTELPIETTSLLSYLQVPVTLAMNWLIVADEMPPAMLAGATLIVLANMLALGKRSPAAEELAEGQ